MDNLIYDNFAISSTRSRRNDSSSYFISRFITDKSICSSLDNNYIFPLYLYPKTSGQRNILPENKRTPNLNQEIVQQIAARLNLTFTPEKETEGEVCFATSEQLRPEFKPSFAPIDLLDYIYAVLYSPTYRAQYKEFLKIDFPRVPYPTNSEIFWQLVDLGGQLRRLHLLEGEAVEAYITTYPQAGSNVITRKIGQKDWELSDPENQRGRIWLNDTQYFDQIPLVAWQFYIGGYQPAQKWLKDRVGRELSFEDILHYQKIIVALFETSRLMPAIDAVGLGWCGGISDNSIHEITYPNADKPLPEKQIKPLVTLRI